MSHCTPPSSLRWALVSRCYKSSQIHCTIRWWFENARSCNIRFYNAAFHSLCISDDDEDWAARRPWGRLPTKRVWLLRTYARKRAVPSQVLSQCRSKSRATVVGWPSSRLTRPTGPTRAGQLPPIARERQCPSQAAVDRCPTGPVMRVPIEKFLIYERLGWRRQRWCRVSGLGGR